MSKITLSKIEHRGKTRIKTVFDKKADLISKIKSIPGRRWSKTKNCWHLPYTSESFEALKNVFGEADLIFPEKAATKTAAKPPVESDTEATEHCKVQFSAYYVGGEVRRKVVGDKIFVIKRSPKLIEAYVPYDKKGWTEAVRNIPGRRWEVDKTAWVLPNVKVTYRLLKQFVGLENVVFEFKIEADIPEEIEISKTIKKGKKTRFELLNEKQKAAVIAMEEQLILKQYSHSTLKSYRNHLTGLFNFHNTLLPEKIDSKNVQSYLLHQIRFKKISESTQNSIINAYKAYVEKVLKRSKEYIDIPRPKKPSGLPNVFSQEEIIRLLEAHENIKHKLMLLIIYSAGLRISEVVNLRVRDINLDRRVMFIKGGKGKKDRYVTLAETVIPYLKIYKKTYNPVYWLLEGQTGGQYSVKSVQNVFKNALEKSKVNAYGTVHTLRHSYATHCVENGFNLALIQKALGHESPKTTERYLHISNNALKKLRSPLDILKDKKKN